MDIERIGNFVRQFRRDISMTQQHLAMVSGTGMRFIIELERGKKTCQIDKVLHVLKTLGIEVFLQKPLVQKTFPEEEGN